MPVIAVAPEAKARSTNSTLTPSSRAGWTRRGVQTPAEASTRPTTISVAIAQQNA